jgi:hypothetical protein
MGKIIPMQGTVITVAPLAEFRLFGVGGGKSVSLFLRLYVTIMSLIIRLKCFFKIECGVAIQNLMDENRFKVFSSFFERFPI